MKNVSFRRGNFLYDAQTGMLNLIDFGAARDYPPHFVVRLAVLKLSGALNCMSGRRLMLCVWALLRCTWPSAATHHHHVLPRQLLFFIPPFPAPAPTSAVRLPAHGQGLR